MEEIRVREEEGKTNYNFETITTDITMEKVCEEKNLSLNICKRKKMVEKRQGRGKAKKPFNISDEEEEEQIEMSPSLNSGKHFSRIFIDTKGQRVVLSSIFLILEVLLGL